MASDTHRYTTTAAMCDIHAARDQVVPINVRPSRQYKKKLHVGVLHRIGPCFDMISWRPFLVV